MTCVCTARRQLDRVGRDLRGDDLARGFDVIEPERGHNWTLELTLDADGLDAATMRRLAHHGLTVVEARERANWFVVRAVA